MLRRRTLQQLAGYYYKNKSQSEELPKPSGLCEAGRRYQDYEYKKKDGQKVFIASSCHGGVDKSPLSHPLKSRLSSKFITLFFM
jgi:hypothetical protein